MISRLIVLLCLIQPATLIAEADPLTRAVIDTAIARTKHTVRYDGSYRRISYPLGDVPEDVGVCTDLVIRAYRGSGIDLQRLVHEDMTAHFSAYPNSWGLHRPDRNIDHRRVPNLERFFERHGKVLAVTANAVDYQAGDIVTWRLPGNLPHIGIVTNVIGDQGRPLVVHNIGAGPVLEDMLLNFEISGHYRYPLAGLHREPVR